MLGGEIGIGEGDRGEADKAVRRLGANLGNLFVLQFDDLRLEVALGLVPEIRVDAEASTSMPCSSITLMRSGVMTSFGKRTFCPASSSASGIWQWA